ncbi:MAG: M20/M25/M40 family metallo-hydrolase, partial [Paraglaciecola sp.]|nr:M20/M25/M40 family metallo-hydrolase [Paraglaciecola sp.]
FTLVALDSCRQVLSNQEELEPLGLNYVTDASALNQHYNCPTLILGPGEPSIMHKTDEYCSVQAILDAEKIYTEIAMRWCT